MPSPLQWQLEGQDTSLTSTVEQAGSAIQRMAADSVAALDRVYAAMQKANGGGSTSSSSGLGAVPAQAQAASDALGKVTASYTASGAAASLATENQGKLTAAMQAVVDAAIKGEGALGAQAAVLTTLGTAESQLAAATLALQRAQEGRDAALTKLSGTEARYQAQIAAAAEKGTSATRAESGLAGIQVTRETILARVTAAEENYVLALNRVQAAQERAAATAASTAAAEAKAADATTAQVAPVGRLTESLDVYSSRFPILEGNMRDHLAQWQEESARFDEGLAAIRAEEEATTTSTEKLGATTEQTGQSFDRLGQHIGNLLVNQAVYAGLNALQQGLSAVNTLLFEDPKAKESAVAVYTVELGNASEALTRFNAVQAESLKLGLPLKELTTLDEHLSQIGVTGETSVTRFGRTLPQLRAELEDLAALPGMDVTKVDEFFTRGAEGANRLALSLMTAGIATRQELQNAGVEFSGFSNNIISSGDATATAVLNVIEKFHGLAAAQADTMTGVEVTIANAWQKLGQDVGGEIFAQSEAKAKELRDVLTDPAMDVAAKRLGKDLGGVADVLQTAEKTALQLIALGPMIQAAQQQKTGINMDVYALPNVLGALHDWLSFDNTDRLQRFNDTLKLSIDTAFGHTAAIQGDKDALAALDAQTAATTASTSGLGAALVDGGTSADTAKQQADQLTHQLDRLKSAVTDLKAEEAGLVDPLQAALDANNQTAAKVAQNYADQTAGLNQQMATVRAQATQASADAQAQEAPYQADLQKQSDAVAALKIKYDALIQPIKDQETALDRVYQKTQDLNRVGDAQHKLQVDRLLAVDLFSAEGRAAAARLPQDEASAADAQAQQTHDTTKAGLEDQVTGLERAQAKEAANIAAQQRGDQDHINAIQAADKIAQAGYKAQEDVIQGNIDKVKAYADQSKEYYDGIKTQLQGQIDAIKTAYDTRIKGFEAEERIIERAQGVLAGTADAQAATLATSQALLDNIIAAANQIGTLQQVLGSPSYPGTSTGVPVPPPGSATYPGTTAGVQPPLPPPRTISATAGATIGPHLPPSTGNPVVDWWNNFTSASSQALGGPPPPPKPPGRAAGGPVDTGWYTVGEQGPELLHAGGSGSVQAHGSGGGITIETVCPDCRKREIGQWMGDANNRSTLRRAVAGVLS